MSYAAVNSSSTPSSVGNYRMVAGMGAGMGTMVGIPGIPPSRGTATLSNPLSQQQQQQQAIAMTRLPVNHMQAVQQLASTGRSPSPALSHLQIQQLAALSQHQQQLQQRLPAHQLGAGHPFSSAHQLGAGHQMQAGAQLHAAGSQLHPSYALSQYLSTQAHVGNGSVAAAVPSQCGSTSPSVKSTPSPASQSQMITTNPVVLVSNVNSKVC